MPDKCLLVFTDHCMSQFFIEISDMAQRIALYCHMACLSCVRTDAVLHILTAFWQLLIFLTRMIGACLLIGKPGLTMKTSHEEQLQQLMHRLQPAVKQSIQSFSGISAFLPSLLFCFELCGCAGCGV